MDFNSMYAYLPIHLSTVWSLLYSWSPVYINRRSPAAEEYEEGQYAVQKAEQAISAAVDSRKGWGRALWSMTDGHVLFTLLPHMVLSEASRKHKDLIQLQQVMLKEWACNWPWWYDKRLQFDREWSIHVFAAPLVINIFQRIVDSKAHPCSCLRNGRLARWWSPMLLLVTGIKWTKPMKGHM